MPKTISFHNGAAWSRGHNIRDERYTDKQKHIDKTLTEQNVTVRDEPVRQAYAEIFGQAVDEYNAKQKRSDRRITDYYDKIKQDKRKHPVYECIVQIGDRSDTGNTAEQEKQALIRFAEEWDKRNPNLHLVGAYIHCDEPDGTVHMHLDYIPIAECTRGMRLQNSLDRALQQQGFHSENIHQTAQIEWQDREREALCAICRDFGIDVQRNQGIGKGREYLTPQEYRRAKEEQQTRIENELKPLKEELDEYRDLDVSAKAFIVEKKKVPFTKKVTVPIEDMERLEEQAKAYRINQYEIDTLRKRNTALDEREQQLEDRQQFLDGWEQELNEQKQQLVADDLQLMKEKFRNQNVHRLLDESESREKELKDQIRSLNAQNSSLTARIAEKDKTIGELQERLKTALQTIRGAYESLTNVVRAVGMLKYDKKQGYSVDLTEKQSRLIDAIAKYGARWAKTDGQPDLAKAMNEQIGISQGIQEDIQELTPKISRSRGGRSL